jgi:tRNA 2-thiocytidine biosynthesis protein TtcA
VEEADVIAFSGRNQLPVVCCACPVCGVVDQKRQRMKALVRELAKENPHLRRSMLGALGNVHPRHLLDGNLMQAGSDG